MRYGTLLLLNAARSTNLPPDPQSAGAARRFVSIALDELGEAHLSDVAELLASELVTNAVLHARTSITVQVHATVRGVRIGVGDSSRRGPRQRDFSAQATTGRGLTLIESLASSWGTDATGNGKTVWFELANDVMAQ